MACIHSCGGQAHMWRVNIYVTRRPHVASRSSVMQTCDVQTLTASSILIQQGIANRTWMSKLWYSLPLDWSNGNALLNATKATPWRNYQSCSERFNPHSTWLHGLALFCLSLSILLRFTVKATLRLRSLSILLTLQINIFSSNSNSVCLIYYRRFKFRSTAWILCRMLWIQQGQFRARGITILTLILNESLSGSMMWFSMTWTFEGICMQVAEYPKVTLFLLKLSLAFTCTIGINNTKDSLYKKGTCNVLVALDRCYGKNNEKSKVVLNEFEPAIERLRCELLRRPPSRKYALNFSYKYY